MADRTVVSRVARQREKRKAEGWHEVKVWVPTKEQADLIRDFGASCRAHAPDSTQILDEQQRSASNFGFEKTRELAKKIFDDIASDHPSLHPDACYRVVAKVLNSLRFPTPKDEVTICLIYDGDEIHRQNVSKQILKRKFIIYENTVFTGPHHVMDDIWSYYQEDTTHL